MLKQKALYVKKGSSKVSDTGTCKSQDTPEIIWVNHDFN